MSWLDKIKNDLIITTGDGKIYKPSWVNPKFNQAWHIAEFDFPNQAGTLVKRNKPMGRKYDIEIYFQGEDHLDTAEEFRQSCNANGKYWTLKHPFYGLLYVQPSSLEFDNTALNTSKISGVVLETIIEENPTTKIDPINAIEIKKIAVDASFLTTITAEFTPEDVNTLDVVNKRNFKLAVPIISLPLDFEKFSNLFNVASAAVNNAIAGPLASIRAMQNVLSLPSRFSTDVKTRLQLFTDQYETLKLSVPNLLTVGSKQIYQDIVGTFVSSACIAVSNPLPSDYANVNDVLSTISNVLNMYNRYVHDLDNLQTATGGIPQNFVPDPASLFTISEMVYLTVSNLFNIALNAKTERSIITEKDTNIIILTHRLYGLDQFDANIDELISENNLGLDQLIEIKKGTKIVYYI